MTKNILNLEGVTVLTKEQQKMVNGGENKAPLRCNCENDANCRIGDIQGICSQGCTLDPFPLFSGRCLFPI